MNKGNRIRRMTIGVMIGMLAFGAMGASAAEPEIDAATAVRQDQLTENHAMNNKMVLIQHRIGEGILSHSAHERAYLKLLAQAYMPEMVEAWTQALAERKTVVEELPEPSKRKVVIRHNAGQEGTEDKLLVHKELAGGTPVRVELHKKDVLAEGEEAVQLPFQVEPGSGIIRRELPAEFQLYEALGAAAETEDAEKVKELLPQLLEAYKQQTEALKALTKADKAVE
jgi:hypothetical protein